MLTDSEIISIFKENFCTKKGERLSIFDSSFYFLSHLCDSHYSFRIYPLSWTCCGRTLRGESIYNFVESFLDKYDIPYLIGNSAPLGGKGGNYISICEDDAFLLAHILDVILL